MSLRTKVALIVAAVVFAYASLDFLVQRRIVLPRFEALERDRAATDALRVRRALLAEIEALDERCSEWTTWHETCAFLSNLRAADPDSRAAARRFEATNLDRDGFRRSRIDLLCLVDGDGTVRWSRARDPSGGEELPVPELAFDSLTPGHPWLVKDAGGEDLPEPIRGLTPGTLGPMFVSSRPVACDGACVGTLILGRLLAPGLRAALVERTEVEFETWSVDGALAEREQSVFDEVSGSAGPHVVEQGGELAAYTLIDDLRGRPALLVRARVDRDISARASETTRYALISTVASGCLLLFVLLFVLRRAVVDPLSSLTRHAVEIGRSDDWSRKVGLTRGDEIGTLSRELDSMLVKLERSRAQLVDAARTAGMSEIATGVLHDVGNVLNGVNVAADLASRRLRGSAVAKLERLRDLVESKGDYLPEFLAGDPKGRHVVPHLAELTRSLRAEHDEVEREIRSLAEGVEHIRELVASQQELAGACELREPIEIGAQVDLAWSALSRSAPDGPHPELEREIEDVGRVRLDRHKLVGALVNLLKNARESHELAGRAAAPIRVRVARLDPGTLEIAVSDEGVGIASEDLGRIFRHGFSTKAGSRGFGLHSCANAVGEMGGRIRAESDGPGRGARFVIELPLAQAQDRERAASAA